MNKLIIIQLINKIIEALEKNLDYLHQIIQKNPSSSTIEISNQIDYGLTILKNINENNLGKVIESLGDKLMKNEVIYGNEYGEGIKNIGLSLQEKSELIHGDINKTVNLFIKSLELKKGNIHNETIQFWKGFQNCIDKGLRNNLPLIDSLKKAIKENHLPMTRGDIDIDKQVMFFCTRITITTVLQFTQ